MYLHDRFEWIKDLPAALGFAGLFGVALFYALRITYGG